MCDSPSSVGCWCRWPLRGKSEIYLNDPLVTLTFHFKVSYIKNAEIVIFRGRMLDFSKLFA